MIENEDCRLEQNVEMPKIIGKYIDSQHDEFVIIEPDPGHYNHLPKKDFFDNYNGVDWYSIKTVDPEKYPRNLIYIG